MSDFEDAKKYEEEEDAEMERQDQRSSSTKRGAEFDLDSAQFHNVTQISTRQKRQKTREDTDESTQSHKEFFTPADVSNNIVLDSEKGGDRSALGVRNHASTTADAAPNYGSSRPFQLETTGISERTSTVASDEDANSRFGRFKGESSAPSLICDVDSAGQAPTSVTFEWSSGQLGHSSSGNISGIRQPKWNETQHSNVGSSSPVTGMNFGLRRQERYRLDVSSASVSGPHIDPQRHQQEQVQQVGRAQRNEPREENFVINNEVHDADDHQHHGEGDHVGQHELPRGQGLRAFLHGIWQDLQAQRENIVLDDLSWVLSTFFPVFFFSYWIVQQRWNLLLSVLVADAEYHFMRVASMEIDAVSRGETIMVSGRYYGLLLLSLWRLFMYNVGVTEPDVFTLSKQRISQWRWLEVLYLCLRERMVASFALFSCNGCIALLPGRTGGVVQLEESRWKQFMAKTKRLLFYIAVGLARLWVGMRTTKYWLKLLKVTAKMHSSAHDTCPVQDSSPFVFKNTCDNPDYDTYSIPTSEMIKHSANKWSLHIQGPLWANFYFVAKNVWIWVTAVLLILGSIKLLKAICVYSTKVKIRSCSGISFDCPICYDEISDSFLELSCGHKFCLPCLSQWDSRRAGKLTCPICREEINLEETSPFMWSCNGRVDRLPLF